MRSRNATASVASSATCSFSTSTVSWADSVRAWRKNSRSPGSPTAPAPKLSTVSSSISFSSIVRVLLLLLGRRRPQLLETARVVALYQGGAVHRELEGGDRRRRDDDALEQVEMQPGVVRDGGLDRIGVRHDHHDLARVVGHDRLQAADDAGLHLRQRLAAGKPGPRG